MYFFGLFGQVCPLFALFVLFLCLWSSKTFCKLFICYTHGHEHFSKKTKNEKDMVNVS
jgi:hypothetical protein